MAAVAERESRKSKNWLMDTMRPQSSILKDYWTLDGHKHEHEYL